MQYLDVTQGRESAPKAKPTPTENYINSLKYILYDVELDFIFLSTMKETPNANHVYIGEL